MKNQAEAYPDALKKNLIGFFLFEADFSLIFVKASIEEGDKYYIAVHVFRIISCLNQVIFACNEVYCINEKKAVSMIDTFDIKPNDYGLKVNKIFEVLGSSLTECYDLTQKLYNEVKDLVSKIGS